MEDYSSNLTPDGWAEKKKVLVLRKATIGWGSPDEEVLGGKVGVAGHVNTQPP